MSKSVFVLAHCAQDPKFYLRYRYLLKNQWRSREELILQQEKSLRRFISFCYERVPFYRRQFKAIGIKPSDIRSIHDLQKIPPISKQDIICNKTDISPTEPRPRHYVKNTGGTTGTPLRYLVSHNDRFLFGALLYRGWSWAGYELGDRMMFLAGSSLMHDIQSRIRTSVNEFTRNIRFASSFKMADQDLAMHVKSLNSWKPKFLRGYPSALSELANHIRRKNIEVPKLKAVLTTSEKLFVEVREQIEQIFDAPVYDGYGANDGGVSANQCEYGSIHVDIERSIMEVVDEDNLQIRCGKGRVLATSLNNYAMPFLRYDVGDVVIASDENCVCGRGLPILEEIIGRTVSVLITPDGTRVHGWFFLYLFWEIGESIRNYKVVQTREDQIDIQIVPGQGFGDHTLDRIRTLVRNQCEKWIVEFSIVESIPKSSSGKQVFIESLLE